MNRNRLVQSLALLASGACLVGTSLMAPAINNQRADLIDNTPQVGMAPKYVLAAASLGSFRGLAVNALWYRAEMLKREDKLFDAKALRDWIVVLQPRFPEVWRYQAWDMAYNISVKTATPQERWDWVNKGIRLLRDEGIPNNPTSVPLYRELAWILFHKVGASTDDMHWYYKLQLAQEWQELLGAPTEGATVEQAVAAFAPIAEMADRYVQNARPSRGSRATLRSLADRFPDHDKTLLRAADADLERSTRLLAELRDDLPAGDELGRALDSVIADSRLRAATLAQDPLSLMLADRPAVAPLVDQLRTIGAGADVNTLRRIGWILTLGGYSDLARVAEQADAIVERGDMTPADRDLLRFIVANRGTPEFDALVAFMRAQALDREFHMDPVLMHDLMVQFGPIDWRHPAAQALYWAYLGVQKAGEMRDRTKIDILNTDRTVIHALQQLFHFGRISYDPLARQIDFLPEPRFVDSYPEAMQNAIGRQQDVEWTGMGNEDSFEAGHENFLLKAVVYAYLYGEEQRAADYYEQVRQIYGSKPHNLASGRYTMPLEDFVVQELQQDWNMQNTAGPFVEGMMLQAFRQGLKTGRGDVFNRFMRIAQQVHERYNKERSYATPTAPRERLVLPPFNQMLVEVYGQYMRTPVWQVMERGQVYANTPLPLAQASYRRWATVAKQHAGAEGIDGEAMFPEPPGLPPEAPAMLAPQPGADQPQQGDRPAVEMK